ncbi:MAG: hypothetical protein AAF636_11435 [Pseudomonadota bacterium]
MNKCTNESRFNKVPKNWELGMAVLESHGPGPYTREAIGCACGVSNEMVRIVELHALKKLRARLNHPAGRKFKKEFLRGHG